MTEIDAIQCAQREGQIALSRLQDASGPDQVERTALNFCIHRLRGLDRDRVSQVIEAVQGVRSAPTMTLRLCRRLGVVLQVAARTMSPEDTRAIALWMMGDPSEDEVPGFVQIVLSQFSDQGSAQALAELDEECRRVRSMLDTDDRVLFTQARQLGSPRWPLIEGCISRAASFATLGDGESYRNEYRVARAMCRYFLEDDPEALQGL